MRAAHVCIRMSHVTNTKASFHTYKRVMSYIYKKKSHVIGANESLCDICREYMCSFVPASRALYGLVCDAYRARDACKNKHLKRAAHVCTHTCTCLHTYVLACVDTYIKVHVCVCVARERYVVLCA